MSANARLFIWFRVLFNARFYYPIFTILFLDLGLTLGEFAALNVVWAVTIVLLEVPSGALADRYGRRPLVIAASVLMVLEMLVLCAMQPGQPEVVFWLFVVNRILSGAAEACASGADEALAYDSLPPAERTTLWPNVMAQLMRFSAVAVVFTSISGAWLYTKWVKWPVVLCLISALACLAVAWRMTESWAKPTQATVWHSIGATWRDILRTGAWIWHSQVAFALIVVGLVFDSLVRVFMTVNSNFYRLIWRDWQRHSFVGLVAGVIHEMGHFALGWRGQFCGLGRAAVVGFVGRRRSQTWLVGCAGGGALVCGHAVFALLFVALYECHRSL